MTHHFRRQVGEQFDWHVVVAGAGPAGAAAARVLATAGHRVLLVDDVETRQPEFKIGETLPAAALPLLRDLGLGSLFDPASSGPHLPSYGRLSAWGSAQLTSQDSLRDPQGHGWLLDRVAFDAALRRDTGAEVRVGRLRRLEPEAGGWRVHFDAGSANSSKPASVTTAWWVDATGRAAHLARQVGAKRQRDDALIAIYAWLQAPANAPRDSRTLIEALPHGWIYCARLPTESFVAALHVDAERANELRTADTWWRQVMSTEHVRQRLQGAEVVEGPHATEACGARLSHFGALASDGTGHQGGWLAVGDASLSFDPLSSQGLFHALYTGLRGGQAIAAALAGDAARFEAYCSRLEQVRHAYLRHHRLYYGLERRWPEAPFWRRRHRSVD